MLPRPRSPKASAVLVAAAVSGLLLVATAITAAATSLGGVRVEDLDTRTFDVTIDPGPGGYIPFDNPGDLNGQTLPDGRPWTVHTGTYASDGAELDAGTTRAVASVPAADNQHGIRLTLAPGGGNRSGGPAVNINAAGTQFAGVLTEQNNGGRVRLVLVNGASVTDLVVVTGVGAPETLTLERVGDQWLVSVDGALVITHTITAPQLALVGANTGVGLFNNANVRPAYLGVEFL